MEGAFPTVDAIRNAVATQDCVLPTETRWKYSNLAFVVAGEVVATLSGLSWAEYVRRHILDPLGMRDSVVDGSPRDPRLARPYGRRMPDGTRADVPAYDLRGIAAAASLTTNVTDLARFAMLQLSDGRVARILKGTTLREMHRVQWLDPDWQAGWGLGFHVQRLRGRTLIGHAGSLRGYRSELRVCPSEKLAVIVFINADDGEPRAVVEKAFEWVAPAIARTTAPPPSASDPTWRRYVGRYRNVWGDSQVLVADGKLTLIGPTVPDPMLAPATLVPVGEHTFRLETKDGFGSHGERVVFELDAAGTVMRMKIAEEWTLPVESW